MTGDINMSKHVTAGVIQMYGFWPVPPKGCRKDSAKITVPETTLSFPKPERGRSK